MSDHVSEAARIDRAPAVPAPSAWERAIGRAAIALILVAQLAWLVTLGWAILAVVR